MSSVPDQPEQVGSVSVPFAAQGDEVPTAAAELEIIVIPIGMTNPRLRRAVRRVLAFSRQRGFGSHTSVKAHGRSHSDLSHEAGLDLPITIYLSAEGIHEQVELAIEAWLTAAELRIVSRDDPVEGSWFRRMRATFNSPGAREAALVAAHVVDTHLVLAQDAAVTMTLMHGVAPVLASLQPTKDAAIRLGAVLIVKVDWIVTVYQLTAAQQAVLDHRPELASAPKDILFALKLTLVDKMADNALPTVED